MTDTQFKQQWNKLSNKQKKFCLRYIQNGFDQSEACLYAGYNAQYLKSPGYRIMRKVNHIIDYLIAKNQLISIIVKPEWIYQQYKLLYQNSASEKVKRAILSDLSKILQLIKENTVSIQNNLPQTPVTINFSDDNEQNQNEEDRNSEQ